jgi:hypothetical protein
MKKIISILTALLVLFAMFSVLTSQVIAQSLPPVACWNFNEGAGTVAGDSSGNGNTGTLKNGPQWVEGISGTALSFDGTNDYVAIADSSSLDVTGSQISIEFWMKPTVDMPTSAPNQIIFDKGNAYTACILDMFHPDTPGALLANLPFFGHATSVTSFWAAGNWYHIAITYDGSNMRIYVNGVLETVSPTTGSVASTGYPLSIGSHCLGGKNFFKGIIDEFAIYDYTRTAEEIWNDWITYTGPPEARGIFVRPSSTHLFHGIDMTNINEVKASIDNFLSEIRTINLNVIYIGFKNDGSSGPDFVSGELFYDSQYDTIINSHMVDLLEQGFDLMDYLIDQAHNYGIEVHAWVPVFNDRAFIDHHEEFGYFGEVRQRGRIPKFYSENFVDPAVEAVRDYEMSIITEIVSKYSVDGINLDYVRYSDEMWLPWPLTIKDPSAIVTFVEEVSEELSTDIVLSADVYSNTLFASFYGQDIEGISRHIDVLMPMVYGQGESIERVVTTFGGISHAEYIVPCLKAWEVNAKKLINNIEDDRSAGADGFALFHYSNDPADDIIAFGDLYSVLSTPAATPWE